MVICWFFVAGIFSSRGSLIQTDSLDLCKFVRGSNSVHSSDFQNMDQTYSAQSRGSAPSNFIQCQGLHPLIAVRVRE